MSRRASDSSLARSEDFTRRGSGDLFEHCDQFRTFRFTGLVQRLRGSVQELVGKAASEQFQHLTRRHAVDQQLPCAVELGGTKLIMVPVEGSDRRHDAAALEPTQEIPRLRRDHRFSLRHRFFADLQVTLDDVRQIVDAIEEYVVELGRFLLDVARHTEINHKDGRVPARFHGALQKPFAEDRQHAGGAGHDDVELVQPLRQFIQGDRLALEARG